VVNGPGSFTGVRVGVSAVKGLAEPGRIPVVAVSRLAVLAEKAGVDGAALDAHRHEVFLRVAERDGCRELLAGVEEISQVSRSRPGAPGVIAVCDDVAAALLASTWPSADLVQMEAPTAADAIELCMRRVLERDFADLSLLDGHYLRRSDAEIFGEGPRLAAQRGRTIHVRRMTAGDVGVVMEIAEKTDHAPRWAPQAYLDALETSKQPRRIALAAEGEGGGLVGFAVARVMPGGGGQGGEAELESIVTALAHQRRGVARELFTALKAELRRSGVGDVMLEVRDGNHAARGFYRFLGFREEGRRRGYYAEPAEDAVLMRLELK